MGASVSARGYTNVLLVLNMKRFVQEQDQARFERVRGRDEFAKALRETWTQKLANQEKFITIKEDKRRRGQPEQMSTEQIGFATGIFRTLMLERFTFPSYALDKDRVKFDDDLVTNLQFKKLFLRAWNKWSIYIRPTYTGFFILRLTNRHLEKPRPFIKLAQDVLRLQESLDIKSAQNWLQYSRSKYADNPEALLVRERSVMAFLGWLGVDATYTGDNLYYPLQWRLAMEVCSLFVEAVGSEIHMDGELEPIHLEIPKPSISIPLHDAYVVHHFTELLADESLVKRSRSNTANQNSQIAIDANDFKNSRQIRQAFVNLVEGSILKPTVDDIPLETLDEKQGWFPSHRWGTVDDLPNSNQATWNDEVCLLNSRTAIIMPSPKWKDFEILVSSAPGATLRVEYYRYWGAIERMIEFLAEIRVFTQLLESASYDLLGEIAEGIYKTQSKLFSGDIVMDEKLPEVVARAAALRHQAALCQSLSHPQLWSRADFAITKADYLLEQFGVPKILEHIERNINSIVEFVNHVDELYLADLSEKSNQNANWLSMIMAAASLTLTILILPSFWADLGVNVELHQYPRILPLIEKTGNGLAVFLVIAAFFLFSIAAFQLLRLRELINRINKKMHEGLRRNKY